jgi:hypothetical protein
MRRTDTFSRKGIRQILKILEFWNFGILTGFYVFYEKIVTVFAPVSTQEGQEL